MNTSAYYSPHDLLPGPEPCTESPPDGYFYDNVAKHLIKDTVRVMANGLPIDLDKVEQLETTLDTTLGEVHAALAANSYIQQYLLSRNKRLVADYIADRESHLKPVDHFLKPFVHSNMNHRSYFMHVYAKAQNIAEPTELLATGVPKWPANTVKKLQTNKPVLQKLLSGTLPATNKLVKTAMTLLATHKAELHNRKYLDQIANPQVELPPFNPSSPIQKRELFRMAGLKSDKISKDSGEESWDRDQIERVNKETADPIIRELTQALIDFSFGSKIKTSYIPAFYKYTVDNRLYGNLKLFGAKTFRYTSQNPNMLNLPSTKSIYAKPVKRCFIAPKDHIVYAIDLSALEDRVIASLSRDVNKCSVFTDGLDGHCLNAYGYFKEEVAQHMPITGDTVTDVQKFFDLQEHGHTALKDIRQRGKPATLTTKRLHTAMYVE